MILTDYYRFEHLPESKSKQRMDCTASTKGYEDFESLRNKHGELFLYYGNLPISFKSDAKRKADKLFSTCKGKSLSSIFTPDVKLPLSYGDVKGTLDAILIINNPSYTTFELFVGRGQKNNGGNLWRMLADGEMEGEISALRAAAVTETVTQKQE